MPANTKQAVLLTVVCSSHCEFVPGGNHTAVVRQIHRDATAARVLTADQCRAGIDCRRKYVVKRRYAALAPNMNNHASTENLPIGRLRWAPLVNCRVRTILPRRPFHPIAEECELRHTCTDWSVGL